MVRRHDPFPMQSAEAQKLARDLENSSGGSGEPGSEDWNRMSTDTGTNPSRSAAEDSESRNAAGQSLVSGGRSNNKKKKNARTNRNTGDNDDDLLSDDDSDTEKEDDFLDRPLWESRPGNRTWSRMLRALENIYQRLYGDQLPPSEMLRTLCLATTLFFMIGGYWLLRSLKDPVLTALCGVSVIPKAKMLSVVVVLAVVSVYNHFLDSDIPRHKLFYIFGTFYFGLFSLIAALLMHPTLGLANQQPNPMRVLGWISYCSIESFGSVMVSLFWSFANSNISLETAKASYGVMVATAQLGSILGPTVVNAYAATWGVAKCYAVGAVCMLLLQGTMYGYIRVYGTIERNAASAAATAAKAASKQKPKADILEGLKLFWKHHYIKGIFAISCLFMVEVTYVLEQSWCIRYWNVATLADTRVACFLRIVDFTLKVLARDFFAEEHPCEIGMSCYADNGDHGMSEAATAAFTTFMGLFGQATNTLSFLLSLFGTSAVIRYLGLRLTLLLFPSLCLAVIIFVRFRPTLYVVFGAMITLKACSYALNNPTKEMLYQPTSSAVRYKAKSWIDIFGARGSKAMGSVVTNAFSDSATRLVANGSLVGMAVASFLIWNATFMGRKFDEYTESGYVVGEGFPEEAGEAHLELATSQNEEDTSCAIYDDAETGAAEEGQEDGRESGNHDDDREDTNVDDKRKPKVMME
jgi:AAA family ATP:ADP antiporter